MAFSFDTNSPLRDGLATGAFRPWSKDLLRRRKELEGMVNKAQSEDARKGTILDPSNPEDRNQIVEGMSQKIGLGMEAQARARKMNPDLFSKPEQEQSRQPDEFDQQQEQRRRRRMMMAGGDY